jgi:hypothetical protein
MEPTRPSPEHVVSFTLESDSVVGTAWRPEIGQLLALAADCPRLDIRRTTGARREASQGPNREEAARRVVLIEQVPEVIEAGVYGVSRYGEATYAGPADQVGFAAIREALWPGRPAARGWSDTNDAIHLATHLRAKRDYFVTTDARILRAKVRLRDLGIYVVEPAEALWLARALTQEADPEPVS